MTASRSAKSLILFDGVCNLCNSAVNFIIDRDAAGRFEFAPLQSPLGLSILARHGLEELASLRTLVLIEDAVCYTHSTAVLRIAKHLDALWPLCYAFIVVPRGLRDALYSFIAANRYRWFGTRESCRLPTPELAARFRSQEDPSAPGEPS